jgi:hypothetical protein
MCSDKRDYVGGAWSHYLKEEVDAARAEGYVCIKCGEKFATIFERNKHSITCKGKGSHSL